MTRRFYRVWPSSGTKFRRGAYEAVEIAIASAGATAEAVRRSSADIRAARWARWSLALRDPPQDFTGIRALAWNLLNRAPLVPLGPDLESELRRRFAGRTIVAASVLHRLQIACLLSGSGTAYRMDGDLSRTKTFTSDEASWLYEKARVDLNELLEDLSRIYPGEAFVDAEPLFVSWAGEGRSRKNTVWIADGEVDGETFSPRVVLEPFVRDDAALSRLARRFFGVAGLRPGQADGAAALLAGRDLSLSMPTGAGKSLVFHLAGLLSPGTALIVAPLRALLRDQARRLAEVGAGPVGLMTGDDPQSTARALVELEAGRLSFALAAPERLDSGSFRAALRGAAETRGVSFIAVDEAHCAARRGHDWRPAYRALGARLRTWASSSGREPALAAVSAGSCAAAHAEAERVLALREPARVRAGSPRTNLSFHLWTSREADHAARLRELLARKLPEGRFGPGIVFCPRVDGVLGTATLAEEMTLSEGIDTAVYTGRPPAGADVERWDTDKRRAADEFLSGRRGLLFATRAFGMGVDRADVRFIVHLGLPASLEEYLQQVGRAGRDGLPAACWAILQILSERRARRWGRIPVEELRAEIFALQAHARDDVSRAYAFHLASFPGEERENRDAELALLALGDVAKRRLTEIGLPGEDGDALTRALLRLEEVGALELRERRAEGWRVLVTGGRETAWALAAIRERVRRDYEAIEPARRASLAELVYLATTGGFQGLINCR